MCNVRIVAGLPWKPRKFGYNYSFSLGAVGELITVSAIKQRGRENKGPPDRRILAQNPSPKKGQNGALSRP